MDSKFIPYLMEMTAKYSIAKDVAVELEDGAVEVTCDKGAFRFFYDFQSFPGTASATFLCTTGS